MDIIPAIDIRGGKVVRLSQGRFSAETVYAGSPTDTAKRWESQGARSIHVVDLDGAAEGRPVNLDIVREIVRGVKAVIELGGGIREEADVRGCIEAGVSKVVIGTRALDEKFLKELIKKYPSNIVVGIDADRGEVRTRGWVNGTGVKAVDLAMAVESFGAKTVNYTDISKDGMLAGPDIGSVGELLKSTRLDIVLAGGISSIADLRSLKEMPGRPVKGVIIGKALYEGRIDLGEAIRLYG